MSATTLLPGRVMSPPNYRPKIEDDPKEKFLKEFSAYIENCSDFESQSKICIYDAPEVSQCLFRQHCAWLAQLIYQGQHLLIFVSNENLWNQGIELDIKLVEQRIRDHIRRLQDWHGEPGSHDDEPASFKNAFLEVTAGDVEDFEL